ncbi:MAG TPA: hypothetical protein VNI56_01710 [Xanthomonadaceae bacterium]|nr:hypothetical protein [Xanthomonadaceae bacterium]
MNKPAPAVDPALADATAHWLVLWPEWEIAQLFLPASQRATAAAWGALLQALTDLGHGGADPTPLQAKRAWWQAELQGWSAGRYRHPLGAALQGTPAPWQAVADVLPEPQDEPSPALAAAVAQIEVALFNGGHTDAVMRTILGDLRMARALRSDAARSGEFEFATGLIATDAARLRRLWSALLRARLARLRRGGAGPPGPLSVLFDSWCAARG